MSDTADCTICFAALHPPSACNLEQYLNSAPLLREIPRRLAYRGYRVHVVQQFIHPQVLTRSGVTYYFEDAPAVITGAAKAAARLVGTHAATVSPALGAIRRIRSLQPDLIHLHGSNLYLNHTLLLLALGRNRPPVVLQYHGGYPADHLAARRLQQHNFDRTERFLFTTQAHAEPFVEEGLLRNPERIVEFMETSSDFKHKPRAPSRAHTRMEGEPVFLWAARLDPIKDPITALRGFARIAPARPGAQLYLYYLSENLLPEVRAFVARRPDLRERVHFRGPAPYDQMEPIYNSADFLLQASRREFSGCAVLEAMACGVIPVVTDIPSFRAMAGRVGVLFPCGDDEALARGVLGIPLEDIPKRSARVRRCFDETLSFDVLAEQLDAVYQDVLGHP